MTNEEPKCRKCKHYQALYGSASDMGCCFKSSNSSVVTSANSKCPKFQPKETRRTLISIIKSSDNPAEEIARDLHCDFCSMYDECSAHKEYNKCVKMWEDLLHTEITS